MKRVIAILLTFSMLLPLCACSAKQKEYISQYEWVDMFNKAFGYQEDVENIGTEETATYSYALDYGLSNFGEEKLKEIIGKDNYDFDNSNICLDSEFLTKLATEKGLVKNRQLKKLIDEETASDLLCKLMDLFFNTDFTPEYSYTFNEDVNVFYESDLEILAAEEDTLKINPEETNIAEGDCVLIRNEYGQLIAKEVKTINDAADGTKEVLLTDVEDSTSIIEEFHSHELADFSYLLGLGDEEDLSAKSMSISDGLGSPQNLSITSKALGVSKAETINVADVEFSFSMEKSKSEMESAMTNLESYVKVSSNGVSTTYKMNANLDTFECKLSKVKEKDTKKGNASIGLGKDLYDKFGNDSSEKSDKKAKIEVKAGIKNFTITENINLSPIVKNNLIEVGVKGDSYVEGSLSGEYEGKYWVGCLPITVPSGMVGLDIDFYITFDANGVATFSYEVDNVNAGISISGKDKSLKNPLYFNKKDLDKKIGVVADTTLEAGLSTSASPSVLGFPIVTASINMGAACEAEVADVIEKNSSNNNHPCIQLSAYGPLASIDFQLGRNSYEYKGAVQEWLDELLTSMGISTKYSYDFWTKENAPYHADLHLEFDKNWKVTALKGKAENVCTKGNYKKKDKSTQKSKESAQVSKQKPITTGWFAMDDYSSNSYVWIYIGEDYIYLESFVISSNDGHPEGASGCFSYKIKGNELVLDKPLGDFNFNDSIYDMVLTVSEDKNELIVSNSNDKAIFDGEDFESKIGNLDGLTISRTQANHAETYTIEDGATFVDSVPKSVVEKFSFVKYFPAFEKSIYKDPFCAINCETGYFIIDFYPNYTADEGQKIADALVKEIKANGFNGTIEKVDVKLYNIVDVFDLDYDNGKTYKTYENDMTAYVLTISEDLYLFIGFTPISYSASNPTSNVRTYVTTYTSKDEIKTIVGI